MNPLAPESADDRALGSPTLFPPFFALLGQQQRYLAQASAAVLEGTSLEPAPPAWESLGAVPQGPADPALAAAWATLRELCGEFQQAGVVLQAEVSNGRQAAARTGLQRLFHLSDQLLELVAGASLNELTQAFLRRERQLLDRYAAEFLDAAQIGRFTVRRTDELLLDCDPAFATLFGQTTSALVGQNARRLLGEAAWRHLMQVAGEDGAPPPGICLALPRSGGVRVQVAGVALGEAGDELVHCFAVHLSTAEQALEQRRLLSAAIEASDQIVLITNDRQEILYVNPAFTKVTGYSGEEAQGRTPRFLQGADTSQATRMALREAIAAGRRGHAEILNYRKNGEPFWLELSVVPVPGEAGGAPTHWIAIERDISERKVQEQEITRLAMEDYLTGLPNRRAAEARLQIEWNRARRDGPVFALALFDIDRFKLVNDQYGHHVGDLALTHVAKLLSQNLRGGDWIARWGGEEFIVCLHRLDSRGALSAGERARKLVRSKPLTLPQGDLGIAISGGVAIYTAEVESLDALIGQADSLLYEAKQTGRDRVICSGVAEGRRGSVVWEASQVQTALHENRIVAAFQPMVDLRSGEVVAEEALARILTRENELVPASHFISAAESLHLIASIDRTVVNAALARGARAQELGGVAHSQFINLSAQFLADVNQVTQLLKLAESLDLLGSRRRPNPLVVEITERQNGDPKALKKQLKPLLDNGFRVAVDDFGSGSSSFRYLADLTVNFLKIEGWMVARVATDPRVRQLVRTIVDTARSFGLVTVAEWVEDAQSAQVLCDLGVDWAQGYFFAAPAADGAEEEAPPAEG